MALSDTKLRNLKPKEKTFSESDGGGLSIEVLPGGKRRWGLRYRLADKQETIRLGDYPAYGLAEARSVADGLEAWRFHARRHQARSAGNGASIPEKLVLEGGGEGEGQASRGSGG